MEEKTKKILLIIIGIFFVAYGFFAMGYSIYRGKPDWIFWACYMVLLIIGIGAIKRSGALIASQVTIVATYLIIWNIDFFYQLINKKSLWRVTDYFFGEMLPLARLVSIEHFFLVPLALYAIYLAGLKSKDYWKISFIEVIVVLLLTKWLTNPQYNVNCVFKACFPILENIQFYFISWMALAIVMTGFNGWVINKMFYRED